MHDLMSAADCVSVSTLRNWIYLAGLRGTGVTLLVTDAEQHDDIDQAEVIH